MNRMKKRRRMDDEMRAIVDRMQNVQTKQSLQNIRRSLTNF